MLDKIRAMALEKLGSEEAANAFMEGFEKAAMEKAGSLAQILGHQGMQNAAAKTAFGIGGSLLGAAIVHGVSRTAKNKDIGNMRAKFDMALAQVMSNNKVIKGARPEKARDYAETMFRFAPHVASDPNLLGYVLANVLDGDTGSGIDIKTIEMLTNLEGRYQSNNEAHGLLGIRT